MLKAPPEADDRPIPWSPIHHNRIAHRASLWLDLGSFVFCGWLFGNLNAVERFKGFPKALNPKQILEVDPFTPFMIDIDCGLDEKPPAYAVFCPLQAFNLIVQAAPGVAENVSQSCARRAEVTSFTGFMLDDFFVTGISADDGGAGFNGVAHLNGEDDINSDIDTLGDPRK